jgi:hypothetical protein
MLEALPLSLALKMCAAGVVVAGGAGLVTVEVLSPDERSSTVVVETPSTLGFADDQGVTSDKVEEEGKAESKSAAVEENDHVDDKVEADVESKDEAEIKEVEKQNEPEAVEVGVVILSPEDGSHHENAKVVFEGEASAGARVFAGPYEASVDDEGNWSIELILRAGANRAVIKAKDVNGDVAEDSITAWLDVKEKPKKDDKPDEPANIGFSAQQQYGSGGEETPYDVFWGTATPNSVVEISSPYGNARVEVGKKGNWEKKVFFETAPRGQTFAVTVYAENGSKTFDFFAVELDATLEGIT